MGINIAYWDSDAVTRRPNKWPWPPVSAYTVFPAGQLPTSFISMWPPMSAIPLPSRPAVRSIYFLSWREGLVTLDYGSGSPQEAAAELAYLLGSPTDTTPMGTGIEWLAGQTPGPNTNWGTVGYWASLRAATPLAHDDGLKFLRIGHPAPFTSIKYWEIGNEEYGTWETDHHGTPGPGGVGTGAQHDPTTYVTFAKQFAATWPMKSLPRPAFPAFPSASTAATRPVPATIPGHRIVLTPGSPTASFPPSFPTITTCKSRGRKAILILLNGTVTNPASVLDWSTRYADIRQCCNKPSAAKRRRSSPGYRVQFGL